MSLLSLNSEPICGIDKDTSVPHHAFPIINCDILIELPSKLYCNDSRGENCPFYKQKGDKRFCLYIEMNPSHFSITEVSKESLES